MLPNDKHKDGSGGLVDFDLLVQLLKDRAIKTADEAFSDEQILQILLQGTMSEVGAAKVSRRIIKTFGDLAEALSADPHSLASIEGLNDQALSRLWATFVSAIRLTRVSSSGQIDARDTEALVAHCRVAIGRSVREQFQIFFLNQANRVIAQELQTTGTLNYAVVYPREVCKRALELNASGIILAHNHPSGDVRPSEQDVALTAAMEACLSPLHIHIYDHLIVSREGCYSFRDAGLIEQTHNVVSIGS